MKTKRTGLKLNQVKALYEATRKGYTNSYAMMVDDAMNAADAFCSDKGYDVGIYSDAGLFPWMYTYIKSGKTWDRLTDKQKQELVELSDY